MLKNTFRYFDFGYYLRFAGLFFFFYLTYTFVNAVSVPSGTYFPFVEKYLNFPILIRHAVLNTGQLFLSLLGYPSTVRGAQLISIDESAVLEMAWACYGLGLKSFWVAFVCAHQMPIKRKVYWSLLGVLTVLVLNCFRVVVMMISIVDRWTIAEYLGTNAHDLFNYVCYTALFGLILVFYKKKDIKPKAIKKPSKQQPLPLSSIKTR